VEADHHQTKCKHKRRDRAITGVYATPELRLAVKYGYRIIKTHELWSFDETMLLDEHSEGLFSEFQTWAMGIKQQVNYIISGMGKIGDLLV
jgi:hypothetical protein